MNDLRPSQSVSVVIGAYNAGAWIRETLDSVVTQTYPVSEVWVVDDGSTDDTARIAASYGGTVRLLSEEHRGRPHRNRGIRAASGDFIAFIDADDLWHPRKTELQMDLLHAGNLAWAICDSQWQDAETRKPVAMLGAPIQEGDILEALFLNNFIIASTPIVARRVLDEIGYFDESAGVAAVEDWDLWLRIAARYPVGCVRQKLATLRLHPDSFLAALPNSQRVGNLEGVVARAAAREPGRLGRLKGRALSNIYYSTGLRLFREHRPREARPYFLQALRHNPASLDSIGYVILTLLGANAAGWMIGVKRTLQGALRVRQN